MTPGSDTAEETTSIPVAVGAVLAALWVHGGQHTARRNAWQAVCADQIHAAQRAEANRVLEALTASTTVHPDSNEPDGSV